MSLTSPRSLHNHVDGEDVDPVGDEWLDDTNPATGELLWRIPRSQKADVDAAVAAARRAQPSWGDASAAERADLCDALGDAIEGRLEELAYLESQDSGKTISQALNIDIPRAVRNFRFFAGAVRHDETGAHEMHGAINYTIRRPVGVIGLITPWNLPLYLLTWKTAPAIAMGNAVVAKPSELTPATASALAGLFREVGAPRGVFNLVHGLGGEAGQALVEHHDVRAISFTGGTATGARVGASAAATFKKLSLELGGKNASLVFADCDFDATVDGTVRASFTNQGQVCLCGSRILVERSLHDRFVEAFAAKVKKMKVGDPSDPKSDLGALVSLAHREKVERYLELAREEGGTIVAGGGRPRLEAPFDGGAFLEPTVITGLAPGCRTATEEIFGPVVTIHPFDTEEEAVAIANGVRYGLSATVWTRDLRRAHVVSGRLDVGMVWVNTWLLRDLRVPFGGVKESGYGREGGRHSLEFFSESRNICIKL
jgi:aminomuconate-semialdehyde/2-hydroxymuconate-6-semialdehyde dehydrogenase